MHIQQQTRVKQNRVMKENDKIQRKKTGKKGKQSKPASKPLPREISGVSSSGFCPQPRLPARKVIQRRVLSEHAVSPFSLNFIIIIVVLVILTFIFFQFFFYLLCFFIFIILFIPCFFVSLILIFFIFFFLSTSLSLSLILLLLSVIFMMICVSIIIVFIII